MVLPIYLNPYPSVIEKSHKLKLNVCNTWTTMVNASDHKEIIMHTSPMQIPKFNNQKITNHQRQHVYQIHPLTRLFLANPKPIFCKSIMHCIKPPSSH